MTTQTKTVGIALDTWKFAIFDKHLTAAGFTYENHPGLTKGTLLLKVTTDEVSWLEAVVRAANKACRS